MDIAWHDIGGVREAGRYPFRDGTVELLEIEIAHWKRCPDAVFRLLRKHPVRGTVEYVLGEIPTPKGP
jgi:hypothetical protein